MRKFFDELRTNLDVETVAAEAAAAVAEQDPTAPKVSGDDLSQIAGEGSMSFKILQHKVSLVCFAHYSHGLLLLGCFVYKWQFSLSPGICWL